MNESTFIASFFFHFNIFGFFFLLFIYLFIYSHLPAFLSSKPFQNNQKHCEITDHYFNIFFIETIEKRKLENCFLGTRVWAPKLVYQSPKWPGCITKNSVQLLDAAPNNLFFQKLILSKTVCICYKHRGCSNQRYLLQILTVKMCPYISLPDAAFNFQNNSQAWHGYTTSYLLVCYSGQYILFMALLNFLFTSKD